MLYEQVKELIIGRFGEQAIVAEQAAGLQPYLIVSGTKIREICQVLQETEGFYFDFLSSISGVDMGVESGKMLLVYHIASLPYNHRFVLKVELDREKPLAASVSGIWKAAEWHEREAFDLYGISFIGHPDLRRILLPDDWEGYPLRKDYETAEEYKGIRIN